MKTLPIVLASILLLAACGGGSRKPSTILPEGTVVQPGDILLRRGNGMVSRVVIMADNGGTYSHVGIAVDSAGHTMVVHAVPGEPDFKGDVDRVKMETPEKFYRYINACAGCVMRTADNKTAKRAADVAMAIYRRGTLFDHDYDDSDSSKMYCCELVEHSFMKAGLRLINVPRHNFRLPGKTFNNIRLPSDFVTSKALRQVTSF